MLTGLEETGGNDAGFAELDLAAVLVHVALDEILDARLGQLA